jgi:hypothetical protein
MSGPMRWEDPELAAALDELREAEARVATPAHVEAAVLAVWDAAHAARATARANVSCVWPAPWPRRP